jgi:flagellar hook-associated protein 2
MAGLTLGGLASGIDTDSVIEQLLSIERAPQARLKLQQSALQTRQQALTDVATRLRSLQSAVKDLSSVATWADTQSLDVSDSTKLTATRLSGAAPGGHTINVTQLARAEQHTIAFTSGSAGTLDVAGTAIQVAAGDSGQDVADKINASPGAPVYAVWVKDPQGVAANDRLVLTRKETGELAPLTVAAGTDWTGADWTAAHPVKAGADAKYTIDDDPVVKSSHSNVVTAAIPGLQLTLKSTGTTSITVGAPGPDPDAVKSKVQAFVDQYNSTIDFIRGKLTEKRVPNATTDTDARKGALFNDTQLTGVLRDLRNMIADGVNGLSGSVDSFGDIGVSTGAPSGGQSSADAIAGKLTLDATKLTDALTNKRLDVKSFLTDRDNGMAAKLAAYLDPIARSTNGAVAARASLAAGQSKDIDDRIALMEERLTAKSDLLRAQFAKMESAMSASQTQGSWLSSQLAAL